MGSFNYSLVPFNSKRIYDTTIRAFNLAEKYRTPVILLMDEVIGHMREKIEIPDIDEMEIINRRKPTVEPAEYLPYRVGKDEFVSPMVSFGEGYRYHVTGLIHDETGFPTNNHKIAEELINRLVNKIEDNVDDIAEYEEYRLEDANEVIIAYGATARSAKTAIDSLREDGFKIGLFRPITIWPMAEKQIEAIAKNVKNYGC